ncbi:hypothetical protein BX616_003433 [Lobosporangium transversale]|nr:hypothetical protein BX616_003433 [Lobosporangium transversale]
MVTLPPSWIAMLEDSRYLPKPRNEFEHLKDDLKAGSWVDIPSLGQVPKGYRVSEILVTHQMLELWNEMEEEQRCVYRRVLSGPMGIGKSFLSYFLTARAYAEGWLTLYISDAGTLDTSEKADSYMEVIERFLVMNKDVLTAAELETLVSGYGVQGGIWNTAIIRVFNMLMQKERKTLTIIDEHGKLFRFDKPVPEKFKSLKPLMDLSSWTEDLAGSRLILTGTAHAKFELEIMESSFKEDFKTVVFVGPLLDDAFKNLLKHTPNLQSTDYEDIRSITNLVPRELMNLSTYIEENPELPIKEAFEKFEDCRRLDFSHNIQNYYKSIEKSETTRTNFYNGLASAFLHGSVEGEFKWDFIDLGLLFRLRRDGVILFRPLCNTAFRALLDQFKTMGMPEDLKNRLKANRFSGNEFEQAIFHAFICTSIRPIVLPTTNLVGDPKGSIVLDFDDYRVISRQRHSLGPGKDKFLARGYPGYPRFDFMVGPIFIQVSVSEFGVHNRDSSDLRKAFKRPYKTPKVVYNDRNQIECYLDEMYGGKHRADFGKDGFIVTKKDPTTGIDEVVPGFRIVYICGRDINLGNHRQLVTELPDVEHVSFNDLKSLFFANIV